MAAALYYAPFGVVAVAFAAAGGWQIALIPAIVVLVAAAVWLWSPLVVLGAAVVSAAGTVAFLFITGLGNTCGNTHVASVVEGVGSVALALPLGAWGVHRRAHALWAVPAGWVAAAIWVLAVAHVVPHGTGACFD